MTNFLTEVPAQIKSKIFTSTNIPKGLTSSLVSPKLNIMMGGIILFLGFFIFMALVQFSTPDMPDNDGYYHIKLAYLMRTQGLKPEFSWLPLTILNQREFYDHHFLYHVGLIPFTFGDLRLGAKWASVVFASLAFSSVWWLLYQQRVRYSWIWAFGLLAVSEAFIYRMSITRAQSLSLAVLALGMHLLFTRKHKWLLPLSFLYVWFYDAFPLMLMITGLYTVSVWLIERRIDFRPLLYSGLGTFLGLIINPYFPYNIIFAFQHIAPKLSDATSIRVGNEWYPYSTAQLISNSPLALLAFISGIISLGLTGRKMSVRTATSLLVAILFGVMLFQARRFVEYFPAFALIFAAFAWTDYLDEHQSENYQKDYQGNRNRIWNDLSSRIRVYIPGIALFLIIFAGMLWTFRDSKSSLQRAKPYDLFMGASAWLEANTPPGSRVFQTDWDDFPRLFFYNTHNSYLVGLDPTYMQLYNEDLYDTWVDVTKGRVETPSEVIVNRFAARYVITDLKHGAFLKQAEKDPSLTEVYRDELSAVFSIP